MPIAPGCGSIEEIDCSYRADSIRASAERQHRMYVGTPIDATHLLFTGDPLTQCRHLNSIALRVCGECHVDYTKPAEFQQAIRSTASDGHLSVLNRSQVLAMEPSLAHLPLIGGIFDSALNSGSCHLFLQALQTKYAN